MKKKDMGVWTIDEDLSGISKSIYINNIKDRIYYAILLLIGKVSIVTLKIKTIEELKEQVK